MTGNIFIASNVAGWFNWFVIKPHGTGHFIHGLTICNNVFRARGGDVTRIEKVDTTFADLDYGRMRNIHIAANSFHGVTHEARNPLPLVVSQPTASATWAIPAPAALPFEGRVRVVESIVPQGALRRSGNVAVHDLPFAETELGTNRRDARLTFGTAVSGAVRVNLRMDNPV